jgi:hypothetical protein
MHNGNGLFEQKKEQYSKGELLFGVKAPHIANHLLKSW